MTEEYKITKEEHLFIKEPQDELYPKQKKIKIITSQDLEELCKKVKYINFVSFSDNTLESMFVFELIIRFSKLLKFIGVVYEPINQPIYCFSSINGKYIINIKICGQYSSWELPKSIEKIIHFADIPDIVICRFDKSFFPVVVVETTGTTNVGNSQWQREGRKLGAMFSNTPIIYQTYYSGTDRSQKVKKGQPREPTSLQVINHIIYSIRYKVPSFVIYFDNPEVDKRLGFYRSQIEGRSLIGNYLSVLLLNDAFGIYKEERIKLEKSILQHMRAYLNDIISKHKKKITRIENDLPVLTQKQHSLFLESKSFLDFIINRIHGRQQKIDSGYNFLDWDFNKFFNWTPGNIQDKPLIKDIINSGIKLLSYKKGISKVGICLDTGELKRIINTKYNSNKVSLEPLDISLPTLIFPGRIWKGEKKIESGDPESGELYAFRELFTRDLKGNRTMNLLLYIFVEPPPEFKYKDFITKNTKLTRSFKYNADLIIVNNKVQKYDDN